MVRIHKDIFEAVVDRNPEEARKAMKRHMDALRKYHEQ